MQDPGREEAASSSASSSVTPQSVDQPAPPMAQMGVVASHQHPGALGPPGPTGSAFFGGVPFAGLPPTQPPASQAAGPSGGFQGPSYAAGQVHYSPAAAAHAGPSPSTAGFQGAVYSGQTTCSPAAAALAGPSGGFQGPSYAAGQVHYSPAVAAQAGPSTIFQGAVYAGAPCSPAAAALAGPSGKCQGALYAGQVPHYSVKQQARRSGPVFPWDTLPTDSTVMSASQKKGDAQAFSAKFNVREDQCGSCFLKTTELFLLENCLHFPFCRQCSIQSSCPKCRVECISRKQICRISP